MLLFVVIKYAVTLYVSDDLVSPCMFLMGITLYLSVMVTPCMFLVGVTCDVMLDIANSIIGD